MVGVGEKIMLQCLAIRTDFLLFTYCYETAIFRLELLVFKSLAMPSGGWLQINGGWRLPIRCSIHVLLSPYYAGMLHLIYFSSLLINFFVVNWKFFHPARNFYVVSKKFIPACSLNRACSRNRDARVPSLKGCKVMLC